MLQSWTNAVDRISNPATIRGKVDETYIKVKKEWVYLYRAVDSAGNTLDFWLSST